MQQEEHPEPFVKFEKGQNCHGPNQNHHQSQQNKRQAEQNIFTPGFR
jgi:hypothetical protein